MSIQDISLPYHVMNIDSNCQLPAALCTRIPHRHLGQLCAALPPAGPLLYDLLLHVSERTESFNGRSRRPAITRMNYPGDSNGLRDAF